VTSPGLAWPSSRPKGIGLWRGQKDWDQGTAVVYEQPPTPVQWPEGSELGPPALKSADCHRNPSVGVVADTGKIVRLVIHTPGLPALEGDDAKFDLPVFEHLARWSSSPGGCSHIEVKR